MPTVLQTPSLLLRDLYAESHVAELLFQILSAVDYLHSRRVIHLDLKSDNMLVDDCEHLKIVDLGSAQSFTPGQPLTVEHIHGLSESKGFLFCLFVCLLFQTVDFLSILTGTVVAFNRLPQKRCTLKKDGCWK